MGLEITRHWRRLKAYKCYDVATFNELIAGEAIFEIGRRLKHVKENDLAHGQWSKWCESIGMDRTTAYRFIKVYDELGRGNVAPWQQIGMKALYEIATLPPDQREKPHVIPSTGEVKSDDVVAFNELIALPPDITTELETSKFPTSGSITLGTLYEIAPLPPEERHPVDWRSQKRPRGRI
jgi:Protein of unknown function (DUF3102)